MTESIDRNALISELGLTMESVFVPFSQSRNAKEKHKSLNWRVTLKRNGRDIITTDYSAGVAHCPAYKASVRQLGGPNSVRRDEAITAECEGGRAVTVNEGTGIVFKREAIEPDTLNVLHSLLLDGDAIDHSSFEDWASDFGYDVDSRKAETMYRQCIDTGLKLRNALGEENLAKLREAFQDY